MFSDEELYRQYLNGKEEGLDSLMQRYGNSLTLYINGYLHDLHEAEDLMIEAFARIFAKERPLSSEGSFKAYLYKTARHLALRHARKHRLLSLRLEDLDFDDAGFTVADSDEMDSLGLDE